MSTRYAELCEESILRNGRNRACRKLTWVAAIFVLVASLPAHAQVSRLIPFQARMTDTSGSALNGVYSATFSIYDAATGGTAQWVETHPNVSIVGGQLNVFLGSIRSLDDANGDSNPNDPIDFGASAPAKFVGVKVGTGSEMVPRHQIVPAFHARTADVASIVEDGAITTVMLAPESVTADKIVDGSIGSADLQAAPFITGANITPTSIDNAQLALSSVDSAKIADGSIDLVDASTSLLNWLMPPGAVTAFAGSSAPAGFRLCDGAPLSRAAYPELFAAIGINHGDGSTFPGGTPTGFSGTHFNLPDYRGRFVRGRDGGRGLDTDRAARTASMAGGAVGDSVGSVQADVFQGHRHSSTPTIIPISFTGSADVGGNNARGQGTLTIGTPVSDGVNGAPRTGLETRPVNAYVDWIIKCGRTDAC